MAGEQTDYYFEGGYLVFTKEYHLKRGYCCKNSCRHCPWKKPSDDDATSQQSFLAEIK